uniref:Uncharacterized protein n=1 Tax=Ascaris lumbricoides TaxID=6252 RepID=A0A0M3HQH4_ASCLU
MAKHLQASTSVEQLDDAGVLSDKETIPNLQMFGVRHPVEPEERRHAKFGPTRGFESTNSSVLVPLSSDPRVSFHTHPTSVSALPIPGRVPPALSTENETGHSMGIHEASASADNESVHLMNFLQVKRTSCSKNDGLASRER